MTSYAAVRDNISNKTISFDDSIEVKTYSLSTNYLGTSENGVDADKKGTAVISITEDGICMVSQQKFRTLSNSLITIKLNGETQSLNTIFPVEAGDKLTLYMQLDLDRASVGYNGFARVGMINAVLLLPKSGWSQTSWTVTSGDYW